MKNEKKKIRVVQEYQKDSVFDIMTKFAESFHNEYISNADNRKNYAEKIVNEGTFLSAYYEYKVVGFMCGYANDLKTRCAYISFFGIDSNIGLLNGLVMKELIVAGVSYAKSLGMEKIRLEVYKSNKHAYRLYKKFGFVNAGEASEHTIYMEMPFSRFDMLCQTWERKDRNTIER